MVGSSGIVPPGWIETDIDYLNITKSTDWRRYFQPGSISAILAEHVWEHLTPDEGLVAARNCCQYLKLGGYLRIAVPDAYHPDSIYVEATRIGGTGPGASDHKAFYTKDTLEELLHQAGFVVEWLEYFDAAGCFHGRDWNPADGMIRRSRRYDRRNHDGVLRYTSLIADARKSVAS